jgi:DNA-binding LacI/PurR family transcriptional regulator
MCEHAFVPRKSGTPAAAGEAHPGQPLSLRALAARLALSPTTVSLVLNNSPGADSIPQRTKNRIFAAAREFHYRPHFMARSLRAKRSYSVGVMVPELSEGYSSLVVEGIEETLMRRDYMYLATSHRHVARQIELLPQLLWERSVEGLILVDTPSRMKVPLPIVAVSGHSPDNGVTNVVLNHDRAAELGIGHLVSLGHRRIAVMKGQEFSSDTEVRWRAIERVARRRGVPIDPQLVVQLRGASPSPATGYAATRKLLNRGVEFTALFAFNDISAFGAIRAFQERGLPVPEAVSVVGFDDIWGAAYHIPALTTIRQPLRRMGAIAAQTLLDRITHKGGTDFPRIVQVEPELVIRESTAAARPAPARTRRGAGSHVSTGGAAT